MDHATQPLKTEVVGNVLVVTIPVSQIEGDAIAEELRAALLGALEATPCKHVVINLEHIQYVSSAAFRPFLSMRRSLMERGGKLVVCGLNPVVGDIFFTTRMVNAEGQQSTIFEMRKDVPEALAFLQTVADAPKEQA
jgi:anti-anti-sigma factor